MSAPLLMVQVRVTDMWRRQTGFLRRTMVPLMAFPVFKLTGLSSMNSVCFQCVGLKRDTKFHRSQCSLGSLFMLLGQNITNFQEKDSSNTSTANIFQLRPTFVFVVMKGEKVKHTPVKEMTVKVCVSVLYSAFGPVFSSTVGPPASRLSK